jgi:hypothetical protein
MQFNFHGTQYERNSRSISANARLLMSEHRHKVQNRQQSMLHRVASEVGIDA